MSNISNDKLQEVLDFYSIKGEQETLKAFGLKQDSLRRYLDEAKLRGYSGIDTTKNIRAILDNYTEEEIRAIANGGRITPGYAKVPIISFEGERIRIGHITDTHIGSTFFDDHRLYQAFDEFKKEGVDFITHSGDVSEGMSNRPGHIYELSEIGFQRQKDKCVELFSQWNDTDIYAIAGNHDCLDEETELLTKRGWLFWDEINQTDQIYSYKNGFGQWDKIDKIIIQEREESLISIETNTFSFLGTKNHRILYSKKSQNKFNDFGYDTAQDLSGRCKIINTAIIKNKEYQIPDDIIRLSAWLLTDGYIDRRKQHHAGRYAIYQSKSSKKIEDIFKRLNFRYSVSTRQKRPTHICGTKINNILPQKTFLLLNESAKEMKQYLPTKDFPSWVFELSKRQFDIFLSSIIDGDGSRYKHTNDSFILYGTLSFLSNMQAACSIFGYRTTIKKDNRGTYRLNITTKTTSEFDCYISKKEKDYSGITWCLSVPETNFMVRRNGTTYFTGNCWFIKSNGADIVKCIDEALPNFHFLGHDEADISLKGKAVLKLWHGGDSNCFSEDTEILTKEFGFILFSELTKDMHVATMTKDGHIFEWQKPTHITVEDYNGDMINIKHRCVDINITPNHGMWVKNTESILNRISNLVYPSKSHRKLKDGWFKITANNLLSNFRKQKFTLPKTVNGSKYIECDQFTNIPKTESKNKGMDSRMNHVGTIFTLDLVRLIAWYVTEGFANKHVVTISQYGKINKENYNEILELVSSLGVNYTSSGRSITIHGKELSEYLISNCGSGSYNKFLPEWIKEGNNTILKVAFETMIKGDGWVRGNSYGYRSVSKQLREDFGLIALKLGYAVNYNKDQVYVNAIQINPSIVKKPTIFHYSGKIYCCEVPNGLIYVRRNGKTLWTHNSYALSYRLQKILESLSGGEKPSVLIAGHVHKYVSIFERNVFAVSVGTLERQTAWMRGKRISAHVGFVISDYWVNSQGIAKFTHTWYPFYT